MRLCSRSYRAQDALNPGVSPNLDKIGRDCLVFFSGELVYLAYKHLSTFRSDTDFANCASNPFVDPLDTSLYKFIVGASLNGMIYFILKGMLSCR